MVSQLLRLRNGNNIGMAKELLYDELKGVKQEPNKKMRERERKKESQD